MIYCNSYIKVADNSGGLIFYCIKIYGKIKKKSQGNIGDILIGSLKRVSLRRRKLKPGSLIKAVIVRVIRIHKFIDGISIYYYANSVVLLNNKNLPIGNRVFGPIPKKLVKLGFLKIVSLAYATL